MVMIPLVNLPFPGAHRLTAQEAQALFDSKADVTSLLLKADQHPLGAFLGAGQTVANLISGNIDAAPVIDAAVAAVGLVLLMPGVYRLDRPLAPITRGGAGLIALNPSCTTINSTFASGDVVTVGDGILVPSGVTVRGLRFLTTVTRTAGAAIRVRASHNTTIENITISPTLNSNGDLIRHWDGIVLEGGANQYIYHVTRFEISQPLNRGVVVQGYPLEVFLGPGSIAGGVTGLDVTSVSGFYPRDLDIILSSGNGVHFHPGPLENINGVQAHNVSADTCGQDCWLFDGFGFITDFHADLCWGSASTARSGLHIDNPFLNGASFLNFHSHFNAQHGIDISQGKNIVIGVGTQAMMNSRLTMSSYNGINIGVDVSDVTVNGCIAGAGSFSGNSGATNQQAFGIAVQAGIGDRLLITDNQLRGNTFDGGSVEATGPEVRVASNAGFPTANDGTAVILAGASSVTISHGVRGLPARLRFLATPTVSLADAGVGFLWLEPQPGNNFIARINGTATRNVFFQWRVSAFGA